MTTTLLELARTGDDEAFRQLINPYERELRAHCYRMLGSIHDAEDAWQESLLAAWQNLRGFQGRASIRTWLYRVVTSRCLNAQRSVRRRPPATPRSDREPPQPTRLGELTWIEPYPDSWIDEVADETPGPEATYQAREAISLAFVVALQRMPPRQRAALILRDVLGFAAGETAQILDCSEEAVTSALKRARAASAQTLPPEQEPPPPPDSPAERRLVDQLTDAYEGGDVDRIISLFTEDAWLTMPPYPFEYHGRVLIARFLATIAFSEGRTFDLLQTRANQQLALATYVRGPDALKGHANDLLVLTLAGSRIAAMTRFDPSLLSHFGLPPARTG